MLRATLTLQNRVRVFALLGYVVYAVLPAYLIVSTSLCTTCSASQLWRVWVLATLCPCILFTYLCHGWGKTQSSRLTLGVLSIAVVLVWFICFAVSYIPMLTFASFSAAYYIQYFHQVWFALEFPSGMVLILAAASAINSLNLTVGFRQRTRVDDNSSVTKALSAFWTPVVLSFSILTGPILLLQKQFGGANQFLAFSVLFCAVLMIPSFSAFHHKFERLPLAGRIVVIFLGLGSFALSGIRDIVLQGISPSHPFQLVALFSAIASSMSSGIGVACAAYVDLRRLRRKASWRLYLVDAVIILLTVVTWYFSTAHYSMVIRDQITVG